MRVSIDDDKPAFNTDARPFKSVMDRRKSVKIPEDSPDADENLIRLQRGKSVASIHFTQMADPNEVQSGPCACLCAILDSRPFHHLARDPTDDHVKDDSIKLNAVAPAPSSAAAAGEEEGDPGSLFDFGMGSPASIRNEDEGDPDGLACCIFAPDNCIRKIAHKIAINNAFNNQFIVFLILLSCFFLAYDEPVPNDRANDPDVVAKKEFLFQADLVLNAVFTFE